ncbi:hypothetical protein CEXT_104881 [Caerostris extrusa]|uniref:Uncharacterized protein n=1 Tax=Caerostris extrusa TaxID=172846 RepID=A0AAV4XW69_CAEEX|nr:hypothetical protein CEXT_104881 [Caerostris extrusa]
MSYPKTSDLNVNVQKKQFLGNPKSYLQTPSLENEITTCRAKIPSLGNSFPVSATGSDCGGGVGLQLCGGDFQRLTIPVTSSSNIEMIVVIQRGTARVARNDAPHSGTALNRHFRIVSEGGERSF